MLTNIRLGFATNSSSSHSILIFKNTKTVPATRGDTGEFGWQDFVLSNLKSKMRYAAIDRRYTYSDYDEFLKDFIQWLSPDDIKDIWIHTDPNIPYDDRYYIDHQSSGMTSEIDIGFLADPHIVIVGGNDNDGDYSSQYERDASPFDPTDFNVIVRHEPQFTTYFFRQDGTKLRFSNTGQIVEKTQYPELVDLKITDYCPHNCSFCYQDSTINGKHADLQYIKDVIAELATNGVFEIALGGGEALLHPHIKEILQYCLFHGVAPNVTTNGVKWSGDLELVDMMMAIYGMHDERHFKLTGEYTTTAAMGVSVNSIQELKKLNRIDEIFAARSNNSMSRINKVAQHVVGSSPLAEFLSAANKERIDSILLLGYKTVGRGTEPEFPVSQEEIIRILNNTEWNTYNQPNISVDTAFLNQYDLSDIVDSVYYTTREGEFSCYIDAVEKNYRSFFLREQRPTCSAS